MKEKFEEPAVQIFRFATADVIAVSKEQEPDPVGR